MPAQVETETHREFNRLRGRLAGFIEACGLPEKQERAIISQMKTLSYETEASVVDLIEA